MDNTAKKDILVSIVTVSYNMAATLEKAIKSLIAQDYPNIEHIIIDGASTDNTLEIIRKYEHDIAYWVSEPDEGPTHALNKGLAIATGDIIGQLNSDDYYEPDTVSTVVEAFRDHPWAGVVHADMRYISQDGCAEIIKPPQDCEKVLWRKMINYPTVFVRKEVYDAYGYFDLDCYLANDLESLMRFKSHGVKFQYINKVLTNMTAGGRSEIQVFPILDETRRIAIKYGEGWLKVQSYFLFRMLERKTGDFLRNNGLDVISRAYARLFYRTKK